MSDREMIFDLLIMERVLTVIKSMCEKGMTCVKCPFFDTDNGYECALNNIPARWKLDELIKTSKENE